jgi:hypothetical protein
VTDDAELKAESAHIEHLLGELRELAPAPAWQRMEDVLRKIVRIYGAGLGRALAHARATGASGPAFDRCLCDDELLASLLVLHGLHPLTTAERVERALAGLRTELAVAEDALAVTAIDDGVVHVRASGAIAAGAMSSNVAHGVIRRVIETAAPEIVSVDITGPAARHDPTLVQLRTRPLP